jgi:energy-coupling factor transporter ATP-binding protein EcfA2
LAPPDVAVEGLTLRHVGRRAPALRDLSLRWAPGERLLLLGPSGSGKSTLTLCLNGVIPHSLEAHWEAGRVLLDGEDTRRADPGDLAGRVGVLFQDPETQLVMLEVDDEIAFGLECLGVPPEEMRRRVAAARAAVGLAGERTPARLEALSGGAKQRVTLAAVLAMGPRALVADEPTANLDPAGARLALRLLRAAARGRSLLLVEHRLDELGGLIDRVAVLDGQGHLALEGPPGRVFGTAGARLDALGVWTPQYATLARRLGAPPDTVPQSAAAAADLLVERWPGGAVAERGGGSDRPGLCRGWRWPSGSSWSGRRRTPSWKRAWWTNTGPWRCPG